MSSALRTRRLGSVETAPERDRRERRHPAPRERTPARPEALPRERAEAGAPTLESKLLAAWAALAAGYPIECPVCGGPYTALAGCSRCGSRLG